MNLSLYTCFHDLISWIIWDRKQYYLLCLVAKRVEEWSEKTLHLLLGNGGRRKQVEACIVPTYPRTAWRKNMMERWLHFVCDPNLDASCTCFVLQTVQYEITNLT